MTDTPEALIARVEANVDRMDEFGLRYTIRLLIRMLREVTRERAS